MSRQMQTADTTIGEIRDTLHLCLERIDALKDDVNGDDGVDNAVEDENVALSDENDLPFKTEETDDGKLIIRFLFLP